MPNKNVEVKIKGDADFNEAARDTERYFDRLERAADQVGNVDGAKLGRSVSKAATKAESAWSRASRKIGGSLRRVAETAGGVLAANVIDRGVRAAVDGFGTAVDAASDMNEALSKSQAVFGGQAGVIEQFATSAADSLGLSKLAALDAAGGFGNMFDQLGFAEQQSASMSQGIVGLAADFASFQNADITQVLEAQSAAFRGEYDALQRFLPLINAATVEQKALELSGKSATKELTAQEKALAVNALMFEGAGKARGDFARTADEAANAERRATAEMENMRAEIGQKLLPVQRKLVEAKLKLARVAADKLVPALDVVVPVVLAAADGFASFISALSGDDVGGAAGSFAAAVLTVSDVLSVALPAGIEIAGKVLNGISAVVSFVSRNWEVLAGALAGAGVAIMTIVVPALIAKAAAAWAAAIPIIAMYAPIVALAVGLAALGAGLVWAYRNSETFRTAVDAMAGAAAAAAAWIVDLANSIAEWVRAIDFAPMAEKAKAVWLTVEGIFSGALLILQGIMNVALGILTGDWSRAWTGIKQVMSGQWMIIKSLLSAGWAIIRGLFSTGAAVVKSVWFGLWNAMKAFVTGAWSAIKGGVSGGVNAVGAAVARLPGKIRSAASRMWNPIYDKFKAIIDKIKSLWSKLSFKVPKINIPGLGSVGGSIIKAATNLFANGNVAREPIAGIFGEYQGARHNPEITTPESLMTSVFESVLRRNGGGNNGPGINIETVVVDERRPMWRELDELENMHRLVGA